MQNKAQTVDEYLASLPEDRRTALTAVRAIILENPKRQEAGYGQELCPF